MPSIVLATGNRGKIRELEATLAKTHPDIRILGLTDFPEIGDIPETGETFSENAQQKAEAVCRHTNLVSLADDSGLVVPALNGEPGIYSARYSGAKASDADNNQKLLQKMAGFKNEQRKAYFHCVLTACAPNGALISAEGQWSGQIASSPRGDNGFGYDPLFVDPEKGCTAAQMTNEEKLKRSHRSKALHRLLDLWPEFWQRANP
ncbi:MAG: XTP/dITP diphosphatase [Thermodesulfobacteriota bacterium]